MANQPAPKNRTSKAPKKPAKASSTSKNSVSDKPSGTVRDFAEAAECLKTLAHPVRLRIVQMLLHGRYTVGELAADCEIPDNVGSEHLRLLQRCGFLNSEREGRRVYYAIAEPHLESLMACVQSRFLPSE
ncbi:DNA-binding transcriptional regulator, ArsR family [Neorhodopirellula lusitana]|uniref:DNA-binding transcriptional regulator, ArsR family n=1 Tax=Neorhodopirellula lusitana TaxID=445327 RepID=A0ABY1PUY3_9BACT|nr:metalloregulator ArsR/SmtB family transcription factor [Neorhodopirellula lusitana]SMP46245.1 DNA-binding transcriptional regulator, ArsR family [Neorhodopirellula lusitana]